MSQDILTAISDAVGTEVFGIWFLIGAALVFFMQCGFAMVETGFTRAKNAGNIIMKNLMDFCLGTIAFVLLGFGLMLGEDTFFGLIGVPNLDVLTQLSDFNRCAEFVFNLVFCATAATIVSGAMAERTKFISYCIYSFVISLSPKSTLSVPGNPALPYIYFSPCHMPAMVSVPNCFPQDS